MQAQFAQSLAEYIVKTAPRTGRHTVRLGGVPFEVDVQATLTEERNVRVVVRHGKLVFEATGTR